MPAVKENNSLGLLGPDLMLNYSCWSSTLLSRLVVNHDSAFTQ